MSDAAPAKRSHALEWIIWGIIAGTILAISVAFLLHRAEERRLAKPLLASGEVPAFALTNQLGGLVSLTNLLGNVWVADVIFSRCPISCEKMSRRMRALQEEFSGRRHVKFVSLTADPDFDSPTVLRRYAERHNADPDQWDFLTGPKKQVYALAVHGLKFVVLDKTEDKETPDDLFIHSTQFVLIDKHGQIRGYFEGTDDMERAQLILAVKKLLREK